MLKAFNPQRSFSSFKSNKTEKIIAKELSSRGGLVDG